MLRTPFLVPPDAGPVHYLYADGAAAEEPASKEPAAAEDAVAEEPASEVPVHHISAETDPAAAATGDAEAAPAAFR